jgi:hypothetical protein
LSDSSGEGFIHHSFSDSSLENIIEAAHFFGLEHERYALLGRRISALIPLSVELFSRSYCTSGENGRSKARWVIGFEVIKFKYREIAD